MQGLKVFGPCVVFWGDKKYQGEAAMDGRFSSKGTGRPLLNDPIENRLYNRQQSLT